MESIQKKQRIVVFAILLAGMIFTEIFVVSSSAFLRKPDLVSLAVTLDLVCGIPALYYFLLVRKFRIPALSTVGVFIISIGIASLILPKSAHSYLVFAEKSLIFAELGIMVFLFVKIRTIIRRYRLLSMQSADFLRNLEISIAEITGNEFIAKILAGEISVLRYGLLFWLCKPEHFGHQQPFTLHKKSGFGAMLFVFAFAMVIETIALHFLAVQISFLLAMILLALSIYSFIFVMAHYSSVSKRPVIFENQTLRLRIGLLWNVEISPKNINQAEKIHGRKQKDGSVLNLAKPILTAPNLLLTFNRPVLVSGIYGLTKKTEKIALYLDEPDKFVNEISRFQHL